MLVQSKVHKMTPFVLKPHDPYTNPSSHEHIVMMVEGKPSRAQCLIVCHLAESKDNFVCQLNPNYLFFRYLIQKFY